MDKEILRQLWDCELKILDKVVEICQKHNLKYCLMWGTLIGAVRHQGFIPWDDDIDISMPREDYNKFLKVAEKELGEEFFLQTQFSDPYHPMFFAKVRLKNTAFYAAKSNNVKKQHGIFIDIMPLDERPESLTKFQKLKNKISQKMGAYLFQKREGTELRDGFFLFKLLPERWLINLRDSLMMGKGDYYASFDFIFPKSDFFPTSELTFEGKKYAVPNNYDRVLTTIYGDYMQLPPPEERVAHVPEFISFDTEKDKEKLQKYLEVINVE